MSIKLTEELLQLEAHVGQNKGQVITEGALVLPANKPGIAEIVKVIAKPRAEMIQVEEDCVVAEGLLQVTLIYLKSPDEDGLSGYESVTWERVLPFSHLFEIPGVQPGMKAEVEFELQEPTLDISGDGRSVQAEWLVDGFAKVTNRYSAWVVTNALSTASRRLDVDVETVKVQEVLGWAEGRFEVGETVAVANRGPAIDQVFYAEAQPVVRSARCREEEVAVTGSVTLEILYRPEGEETVRLLKWEDALRFEQVLDLAGAKPGSQPIVDVRVTDLYTRPVVGGTGLEVQVHLALEVKVVHSRSINLVESIAADREGPAIACRREEIRLEQRIGRANRYVDSKFTIEVPESKPPVNRIISFQGRAKVADVTMEGSRITVTGFVDVEMLYEGHVDLDAPPVYFAQWGNAAAFETLLEIPGAESGMDVQVDVEVAELIPDLINRETCEVHGQVNIEAQVVEVIEREVVVRPWRLRPPRDGHLPTSVSGSNRRIPSGRLPPGTAVPWSCCSITTLDWGMWSRRAFCPSGCGCLSPGKPSPRTA